MELAENSIWKLEEIEGFENGLYRLLSIYSIENLAILFCLNNAKRVYRPQVISLKLFLAELDKKRILPDKFLIPSFMQNEESALSEKAKQIRDKNFNRIKKLILDKNFTLELALNKYSSLVSNHAKSIGADRKVIFRYLNSYWRYGQDKQALLPAYKNSGARGKTRKVNGIALGAPRSSRMGVTKLPHTFILQPEDKNNIKKALKKYHLKSTSEAHNLKETYRKMLQDYYRDESITGFEENRPPYIPSYRQFCYWSKKLFSHKETIAYRTTENDFLKNKRAVLGSATDSCPVPGSCFEIDATVADVHLVSEFNRNKVLGRPTIYSVVDRASRMIVGLHVSWMHASWEAARQALVNTFLPKSNYCHQFGVDIKNSDWPAAHIPQRLTVDNGEMIGLKPKSLVVPLTQMDIAPPYRPEMKGIVEKRFDILNKKLLHTLRGTTRGKKCIRGDKDPRKEALFTIKELTSMLIHDVLDHNKSLFNDLALNSRLLVENDLAPTPINFWNVHVKEHRHALKYVSEIEVIARLLPSETVSMTRSGILYNNMYYTCELLEVENLASTARTSGRWKMEARIDHDNSSFIYVKLKENQTFTKCYLLPKSKMMKGLAHTDVVYMQDWLDEKKNLQPVSIESIDSHKHRKTVEKKAKDEFKTTPKVKNKNQRIKNMQENRRLEQKKLSEGAKYSDSVTNDDSTEQNKLAMPNVIKMPRSNRTSRGRNK